MLPYFGIKIHKKMSLYSSKFINFSNLFSFSPNVPLIFPSKRQNLLSGEADPRFRNLDFTKFQQVSDGPFKLVFAHVHLPLNRLG